jgi:ABC-type transport system involved in multi-copper enzyme maturation permease subunit
MNLAKAFRAEWLKLRKRPGVWILLLALAAIVLLFGYVVLWAVSSQLPPEAAQSGLESDLLLEGLRLDNVPAQVTSLVASFGTAFGLILGALAVGSEYGWRTVKTMTTQRPGRVTLASGRALALLAVCVLLALIAFLAGAAGAALVSALESTPMTLPTVADTANAFGIAVLVIALWCALGACFATLFRGTGWAIGFGLLYAFALEFLLSQVPLRGRAGELLADALINNNTAALVLWLSPDELDALNATPVDIEPLQAVTVLVAYLVVALLVTVAVYARRDIA